MCLKTQIYKCLYKEASDSFILTVRMQDFDLVYKMNECVCECACLCLFRKLVLYLISLQYCTAVFKNPHVILPDILTSLIFLWNASLTPYRKTCCFFYQSSASLAGDEERHCEDSCCMIYCSLGARDGHCTRRKGLAH